MRDRQLTQAAKAAIRYVQANPQVRKIPATVTDTSTGPFGADRATVILDGTTREVTVPALVSSSIGSRVWVELHASGAAAVVAVV